MFAAWLDAHRFTRAAEALDDRALAASRALFARTDAELAHPELAKLWDWLAPRGRATVDEMRRATGASKGPLDRLSLAGPVSRTLGASAEIAATCGLYLRHTARLGQPEGGVRVAGEEREPLAVGKPRGRHRPGTLGAVPEA